MAVNPIATPTVSSPTLNLSGTNVSLIAQMTTIPKVSCVADAERYPHQLNTEDVLLDQNDPDVAYFRHIDQNGFVQIDRRRCVPEPEPTLEELNDRRYLSREEFASFMESFNQFREEMSSNVRILTTAATNNTTSTSESAKSRYVAAKSGKPNTKSSDDASISAVPVSGSGNNEVVGS